LGITAFVYSADQGMLSASIRRLRAEVAALTSTT
jgi:hypothetical protein